MNQLAPNTKFHRVSLAGVTLLLAATFMALKKLDALGIPIPFAITLLFGVSLFILLIYELLVVFKTPLKILGSILFSGCRGMLKNFYIIRILKRYPSLIPWIKARFSTQYPTGIMLTMGVASSILFLSVFFRILEDILLKNPLLGVDQRMVSLLPSIWTPEQTRFFVFVTFLANWQSILFVSMVMIAALTLWKKQYVHTVVFFGALIGSEGIAFILKHLVGRLRPEDVALIREEGFSFPSGHAIVATIIFGFLGYLMIRSSKHPLVKIFSFVGCLIGVLLVGASRIYLGVHFLSDVLAGMALGCFFLSIAVTAIEINKKYEFFRQPKIDHFKSLLLIPTALLLFSFGFNTRFIHVQAIKSSEADRVLKEVNDNTISQLPTYSETLTGAMMEPISFIYIGSEEQIQTLFSRYGWYKADPLNLSTLLKGLSMVLKNKEYLTGPVTPSYINGKPEDLAFQQPTENSTFRERHHTRLWKTNYVLPDNRSIWEGTASFDQGMRLGPYYLPTHSIAPNIDAERDYIVRSLGFSSVPYVQISDPHLGQNSAGDQFFTDGKAAMIELSN
ncbi:LssY C-terminal domain-containing protein [Candidatus Peregrinibacteria bacterium]|nr:LssY C-terminal domain-containing protein [Candidatus Peregrinibacteria bacterium]